MAIFDPIGRAMEYPVACATGSAAMVTGDTVLEQSILQILSIDYGSLPATPTMGSRLSKILFQPIDKIAINAGEIYIREAIQQQEPRVNIVSIDAVTDGAAITFTIVYMKKATGELSALPFTFIRKI